MVPRSRSLSLTALLLWHAGLATAAAPGLPAAEPAYAGWTLILDNDALVPGNRDQDYTGGIALTYSGSGITHWPLAMHRWVDWLLDGSVGQDHRPILHSYRFGGLAFTPNDLANPDVVGDDRPYASLLFLGSSSIRESGDGRSAVQGSILLGALGLNAMAQSQREFHQMLGDTLARGWDHQVSDGGEPTAIVRVGRQRLHARSALPVKTVMEFKSAWDLSAGAETAGAYAASMRWGRFNTPWWSHAPEQIGYVTPASPAAHDTDVRHREFYLSAGARLRLSLYNVFLQGQFRHSDHRLSASELRYLTGEAWAGLTWEYVRGYRAGWVVRLQTSELRGGDGDRSLLYGGLFFSRDL